MIDFHSAVSSDGHRTKSVVLDFYKLVLYVYFAAMCYLFVPFGAHNKCIGSNGRGKENGKTF